jgi:hypothetical protein
MPPIGIPYPFSHILLSNSFDNLAHYTPAHLDITFFAASHHGVIMEYPFGHGFFTSIMLIIRHFALPPEQAWFGAGDHVEGMVLPEMFKGTDVEEITILLKKKVIWHQPGTMDNEEARDVVNTLNRLVVAIDRELGIADASIGDFR